MTTTTDYYDQAISKLKSYRLNEPDRDKRDAATVEIDSLILAKQASAFDDIANRSAALQTAVAALQNIANSAGDGPGISDSIDGINTLIAQINSAIDMVEQG